MCRRRERCSCYSVHRESGRSGCTSSDNTQSLPPSSHSIHMSLYAHCGQHVVYSTSISGSLKNISSELSPPPMVLKKEWPLLYKIKPTIQDKQKHLIVTNPFKLTGRGVVYKILKNNN